MAIWISLLVAGLLSLGTRESATVNLFLVAIKMVALLLFVYLAAPAFNAANLKPFAPYGFVSHEVDGVTRGAMAGAAI